MVKLLDIFFYILASDMTYITLMVLYCPKLRYSVDGKC